MLPADANVHRRAAKLDRCSGLPFLAMLRCHAAVPSGPWDLWLTGPRSCVNRRRDRWRRLESFLLRRCRPCQCLEDERRPEAVVEPNNARSIFYCSGGDAAVALAGEKPCPRRRQHPDSGFLFLNPRYGVTSSRTIDEQI